MSLFESANQVLSNYMIVFFVAFAISFVTTPLMRLLAVRHGIVDWPDLRRKSHIEPVAYLGGVALFLGWTGAVAVCYFIEAHGELGKIDMTRLLSIAFGAACITITGLFDDVYGISPRVKVGGQFLAAGGLAYGSQNLGMMVATNAFGAAGLSLEPTIGYIIGAALIGLFVLGGCNSVNLLDGLDGLAGGVMMIACLGFLAISVIVAAEKPTVTDPVRLVMCLALLGALLGFLPYNFNPANIFLGDAGSMLLGYLCVSAILLFADRPRQGPMLVMAALIVIALPITDTALAIFRRKMRGKPLFAPDDQHVHHQLLRVMNNRGVSKTTSVKLAVLVMYLLALIFALLGCALVFLRWRFVMAVFFPLFGFIVVSAYKVGHRQSLRPTQSAPAIGDGLTSTSPTKQSHGVATSDSIAVHDSDSNAP